MLFAHPQDIRSFLLYCGLIRYICEKTTSKVTAVFFVEGHFENFANRMYRDLIREGRMEIVPIEGMTSNVFFQKLMSGYRNDTTRHLFGVFDKFRPANDDNKNRHTSLQETYEPYDAYGYSRDIMYEYFFFERDSEVEEAVLNQIKIVARSKYGLFSSTDTVLPNIRGSHTISIGLDRMFGSKKMLDSLVLFDKSSHVYLIPGDAYTLFVFLASMKFELFKFKRVALLCNGLETLDVHWYLQNANTNHWKKMYDSHIVPKSLEAE
tara:strand:- start:3097 stop:3891 length:795 start_codon:yes stop_codon:yes gene_type:complete